MAHLPTNLRKIAQYVIVAAALAGATLACGSSSSEADSAIGTAGDSGTGSDGATLDLSGGDAAPEVVGSDGAGTSDAGVDSDSTGEVAGTDATVSDTGICTGVGCACTSNGGCDSGLCIETAAGQVCAKPCTSDCSDGFKCTQTVGVGGDVAFYCLPSHIRLCEPCAADADCSNVPGGGDSRCVPYTSDNGSLVGNFCGNACGANNPCPDGYTCKDTTSVSGATATQCVRNDLTCACDARAVAKQLGTTCSNASALGSCSGKRVCGAAGLSACDAPSAQAEQCNLKDDDCDGQTDEPTAGMCDDGQTCTYDNCTGGECQHPPKTGPCDDGSACTSGDKCTEGLCAGTPVVCDDGNPCTNDGCDLAKGCTTSVSDGGACDDGNACSTGDTCKGGICLPGDATTCDDNNPCTTDSCKPKVGCVFASNTAACDDGSACTNNDACKDGVCVGGGPVSCGDGNPCTDDSCDPKLGCGFANNTASCSDGNACTVGDTCAGGVCLSAGVTVCNDNNPCTTDG